MWYTTDFEWKLLLDKDITVKQMNAINTISDLSSAEKKRAWMPDWYCQRVVSDDWSSLWRDWGEKFYDYVERLESIVKNYMDPWWIKLNWSLRRSWEEVSDNWLITVKDNVIKAQELWVLPWVCPHCWERIDEE